MWKKINLKHLWFGIAFLVSCTSEIGTSNESLFKIIDGDEFRITSITYGGLIGQGEISYNLKKIGNSTYVKITNHFMYPDEFHNAILSDEEYNSILASLFCMTEMHQNIEAERRGCQPPFTREYYVEGNFYRMRIYSSVQDSCTFEMIFWSKYQEENLIEL